MNINEAIAGRSSVRDFTPKRVDDATIKRLLEAAVHAPTAIHEELWAFVVVQDKPLLNRLSNTAKELLIQEADHSPHDGVSPLIGHLSAPAFNAFYNATTLIIICGKTEGEYVAADCWLAAQNLMLTAYGEGLGTCVIGMAVAAMNTSEWKKTLGIPPEMTAFVPILIGTPASKAPTVPRKPPKILHWQQAS